MRTSVVSSAFLLMAAVGASASGPDPAKVIGPDDCGECHEDAHRVWSATPHARGWTELSGSAEAQALAEKLGVRRIKRDERCVSCHFLSAVVAGVEKPISGVACESCHGAAADWIDLHWDFGPGGATAATETESHRVERLRRCDEAGLARPALLARLASACYGCHVITDEDLLAAGHPATGPLELVAATQGSMRHNFVRGAGENATSSRERQCLMHAVGRLLDWSATLKALSRVERGAEAAGPLGARAAELRALVAGLQALSPRPEFVAALEAGDGESAAEAAASIAAAAGRLAEATDGSALTGLAGLLPAPSAPAPGD